MGWAAPGRSNFLRYAFFHTLDVVNLIPTNQPSLDHALYVLQTYVPTQLEHKMNDTPTISQKNLTGSTLRPVKVTSGASAASAANNPSATAPTNPHRLHL